MSSNITDDKIIKHKKNAIKQLNKTFEAFINSPNPKHKKKADLIAYWIETYSQYLLSEERFDYTTIPKYKRGDVISLNFGFNVGSEHGGLHYAIVLDNENKQSSPVITVLPLSSGTEHNTHNRDIFLGNELHDKLLSNYNKFIVDVENNLKETTKIVKILTESTNTENQKDITELLNELNKRTERLIKEQKSFEKYKKEIDKLKNGSIALMEQITTVSKIRIYKPKNKNDLLYDIQFSSGAMDKINNQLKKLYIHGK